MKIYGEESEGWVDAVTINAIMVQPLMVPTAFNANGELKYAVIAHANGQAIGLHPPFDTVEEAGAACQAARSYKFQVGDKLSDSESGFDWLNYDWSEE